MSTFCAFPVRPFDGQVFIDASRVRWIFNSEEKSWKRSGVETDIPVATNIQPGLLSAQFKQLLDSLPVKGGHFGIIARPLLSVVPLTNETLLKDSIEVSIVTASGSMIRSTSAQEVAFEENKFAGKLLRFTSGILKNAVYLIANNNDLEINLIGDASSSKPNDKFEILEPTALNLNGVIAGDVQLVSESIEINCVDHNDDPIVTDKCDIRNDNLPKPPALDFKVSDLFKSQFCVQQPGCEGPRGNRGLKGNKGADGTGDGPQGDIGDPGISAPSTPMVFDGIKIVDIDDIYDTAVVALEIDAPNGRLNVVKAKLKTPDDNTPTSQLITTEVFRTVDFTGNNFDFNLLRPNVDPIGTDDVKIAYYPQGFDTSADASVNRPQTSPIATMDLSGFVTEVCDYWEKKLKEISDLYDKQIKEFIESKDKAAREALASLCQELAACEWERPIEFCLGINPSECNPLDVAGRGTPGNSFEDLTQSGQIDAGDGGVGGGGQTPTISPFTTGFGISGPNGNKILIPVPPLAEQQLYPRPTLSKFGGA